MNYSPLLYVNNPAYVADFFRGGMDVPRAEHGAMRDALDCCRSPPSLRLNASSRALRPEPGPKIEAENCYCVDRGYRAEIYTLR